VKLATVTALLAAAALHTAAPASASCVEPSLADRPDAVQAFQWHVVYAFPSDAADRFEEWGPRIVRDQAEIDAWFRAQDPARTFRYDIVPGAACAGLEALDVSLVRLPHESGHYAVGTFWRLGESLRALGFSRFDKRYLVYYDGPSQDFFCGYGGAYALVYVTNCPQDGFRQAVAVHEMLHVLGAGHVSDSEDVMYERIEPLWQMALDPGRDEYYGHGRSTGDVRASRLLERVDSPDRSPPAPPAAVTATGDASLGIAVSWSPSLDDAGPVSYLVSRNGELLPGAFTEPRLVESGRDGETIEYEVRAVDGAGRISAPVSVRFRVGYGIVDAAGMLVRDTVAPAAVAPPLRVAAAGAGRVRLSWRPAVDRVGVRGYEVTLGGRRLFIERPSITLAASRARGRTVTIRAVDAGGNTGAAVRFRIPTALGPRRSPR
jgi:hypothetical protein